MHRANIRQAINAAMDSDQWALAVLYRDRQGNSTRRIISPIRWTGPSNFLAFCLGRLDVRQFRVQAVLRAELIPAETVLAPERIEEISE